MAKYLVETDQGKFEVETEEPSGPEVMAVGQESVFGDLPSKAVSALNPPVEVSNDTTAPGLWQSVLQASKEMVMAPVAPLIPGLRENMLSPQVGQFGLSGLAQQEGERVNRAVDTSIQNAPESSFSQRFPRAGAAATLAAEGARAAFPQGLTPRGAAESIGGDVAGELAATKIVRPALDVVGTGVSKIGELASGVPAQTIKRVIDDPSLILPKFLGGPEKARIAGKALGEAEKKAGFVAEEGVSNPFTSNQSKATEYFERVAKGEELTPQEMLDAYKSSSDYLKTVSRKDRRYVDMVKFEKAMQDTLKKLSSDYSKATVEFAKSATKRSTTNLLPRTQTGKISQGRVGFNALLTGGGLLSGGVPAAAGAFVASSPLTYGLAAAGIGATENLIEAVAKNPGAMKFLQGYANSLFRENLSPPKEEKKFTAAIQKAKASLPPKKPSIFAPDSTPAQGAETKRPADVMAYVQGLNAVLEGDYKTAETSAKKALSLNPKNREAEMLLRRLDILKSRQKQPAGTGKG